MIAVEMFPSIINLAILMSAPIAIASIGETFGQRSGVVNLGLEGIMLISAFFSFHLTYTRGDFLLSYVVAALIGGLIALLHAFLTVTLRLNQTISGMGIYFFGYGLSDFLYKIIYGVEYVSIPKTTPIPIPGLSSIPIVGYGLFTQYPSVYVLYVLLPIAWFVLERTKYGLYTKAVGENPRVADSLGVNVTLYKYVNVFVGGVLAGFAGAALCLDITGLFYENLTLGMGFIAVGLVAFGKWNPLRAFAGSLIFGFTWSISSTLQTYFQRIGLASYVYLLLMLPYLAVVIALVIMSRRAKGPSSLGQPYFREF